jgi:hypothetical protein
MDEEWVSEEEECVYHDEDLVDEDEEYEYYHCSRCDAEWEEPK